MSLDLSLPSGLRDLLPDHSAHLAELSAGLHEVFSRFGYRRVFLPTLERLEAARPDALPSPARLCYDGPVLRAREARAGRPREVYQAGVEMLGAGGPAADAEALLVLARSLERVGLEGAGVEV